MPFSVYSCNILKQLVISLFVTSITLSYNDPEDMIYQKMSSDFGIYGLTTQGINLALNLASKGFLVTVGNKSSDKVESFICMRSFFLDQGVYGIC